MMTVWLRRMIRGTCLFQAKSGESWSQNVHHGLFKFEVRRSFHSPSLCIVHCFVEKEQRRKFHLVSQNFKRLNDMNQLDIVISLTAKFCHSRESTEQRLLLQIF
jgi:hypothetical protein